MHSYPLWIEFSTMEYWITTGVVTPTYTGEENQYAEDEFGITFFAKHNQ